MASRLDDLAGNWATKEIGTRIVKYFSTFRGKRERRRRDLLREVFGSVGTRGYSAAQDHRYSNQPTKPDGYPSDREAIVASFYLLENNVPDLRDLDYVLLERGTYEHAVVAGSPVSSSEAAKYLPHWEFDKPKSTSDLSEQNRHLLNVRTNGSARLVSRMLDSAAVPYHFLMANDDSVRTHSASQNARLKTASHNAVVIQSTGDPWVPKDDVDGILLKRDFLLISLLPWNTFGGKLLLLSGGHGAGIASFKSLLNEDTFPEPELRKLECLSKAPYFQLVLEISDINIVEGLNVGHKISVSNVCQPLALYELDRHILGQS